MLKVFSCNQPRNVHVLLLILIFCFAQDLTGQSKKIDSLKRVYQNATHDTMRCRALILWGGSVDDSNPDTAIILYHSVIKIADKALKQHKKGTRLYNVFTEHLATGNNNLGTLYFGTNNIDSSKKYMDIAINLYASINEKKALADNYSTMSALYSEQGNYPLAIEYELKNLNIIEELNDTLALPSCLNNLGVYSEGIGNITEALNYYSRCLKICELTKDKFGVGMSYLNIARNLNVQGEIKESLDYFLKSLKIMEDLDNHRAMTAILYSIGNVYSHEGDYEKSLTYLKRAIISGEKSQAKKNLAGAHNALGNLYVVIDKLDSALIHLNTARELSESTNDKVGLTRVYTDMSKLLMKQGKTALALEYSKKSFAIAQEIGLPRYTMNAAKQLKEVYQKKGDANNALKMYEIYVQMNDSSKNEEAKKVSIRTQMQHEYDKKETELKAQAEKESLLAAQRSEKQQITIWSAVAGLILVIIFTVILFNRLRVTRIQKDIIDKKNKENEILLAEIHHRVKNNLQVISSLLNMQGRNIENEKARSAIMESKERLRSMELIHKLLYRENYFSGVEMHEYLKTLTDGLTESFNLVKEKDVEINLDFNPITIDVDTAVPLGLILNELIVNSFKYAKSETEKLILKIALHEQGEHLNLSISDNGKGKKSEIENSNSFGLRIIKALIKQLNGTMEVSEQNGLVYNITLKPLKIAA